MQGSVTRRRVARYSKMQQAPMQRDAAICGTMIRWGYVEHVGTCRNGWVTNIIITIRSRFRSSSIILIIIIIVVVVVVVIVIIIIIISS